MQYQNICRDVIIQWFVAWIAILINIIIAYAFALMSNWHFRKQCYAQKTKSLVFDNGKCTIEHLKFKKYTTIKYRESKYFLIYWFYCWIFDSLYWMKNDKWNKTREYSSLSSPSFDRSHPKRNFIVASCIPIKREWSNSRK